MVSLLTCHGVYLLLNNKAGEDPHCTWSPAPQVAYHMFSTPTLPHTCLQAPEKCSGHWAGTLESNAVPWGHGKRPKVGRPESPDMPQYPIELHLQNTKHKFKNKVAQHFKMATAGHWTPRARHLLMGPCTAHTPEVVLYLGSVCWSPNLRWGDLRACTFVKEPHFLQGQWMDASQVPWEVWGPEQEYTPTDKSYLFSSQSYNPPSFSRRQVFNFPL